MKRFYILLLPLLLVFGCTEPTPTAVTVEETVVAGKKGQNKVDVCHVTGNGSYILITIAEPALPAHLNHGDGQPGDPVPGMEGFVFDDSCELVVAVPTDGLVAYYPFNGNANDESGNGHDGTVNGATLTTDRFGNANSAYSFGGQDDFILVPNDIGLVHASITVAAWANFDVLGEIRLVDYVASDLSPRYGYELGLTGTNSYFFFQGENLNDRSFELTQSVADMVTQTWYFFVGTYDQTSGKLKLYVDGVFVSEMNLPTDAQGAVNHDLVIGSSAEGPHNNFFMDGVIDDIRIYNRALTETEVEILFNE